MNESESRGLDFSSFHTIRQHVIVISDALFESAQGMKIEVA